MYDVYLFDDNLKGRDHLKWWQNFLSETETTYASIEELNEILKDYNARFYTTGNKSEGWGERHVIFDCEKDYSMFLLKFS